MIDNSRERKIETGATMPTIKRYRKRPVAIEAVQLNIHNVREVAKWCGADLGYTFGSTEPDALDIHTLEGTMAAYIDDYIIRGVAGEFYPCKQIGRAHV